MYHKYSLSLALVLAVFLASCTSQPEVVTTINQSLQDSITHLLKHHMAANEAKVGEVYVMDTQSGHLLAHSAIGFDLPEAAPAPKYYTHGSYEPGSLMHGATMLACLESGKITTSTMVDAGEGIYRQSDTLTIYDNSWRRGGFGVITAEEAVSVSSNVGMYKLCEAAFDSLPAFKEALAGIHFGTPDSMPGTDVTPCRLSARAALPYGYDCLIHPLQLLAFYNAVALGGRMLQPTTAPTDTIVLADAIASPKNVAALQQVMAKCASDGTARSLSNQPYKICALTGNTQLYTANSDAYLYRIVLCGYFPAENPRYTLLAALHKRAPAYAGVHCSALFLEVARMLMTAE